MQKVDKKTVDAQKSNLRHRNHVENKPLGLRWNSKRLVYLIASTLSKNIKRTFWNFDIDSHFNLNTFETFETHGVLFIFDCSNWKWVKLTGNRNVIN